MKKEADVVREYSGSAGTWRGRIETKKKKNGGKGKRGMRQGPPSRGRKKGNLALPMTVFISIGSGLKIRSDDP